MVNALGDVFRKSGNAFSCAWQVLRYLGSFLCPLLRPKAALAARIPAVQSPPLILCNYDLNRNPDRADCQRMWPQRLPPSAP